MKRVVYHRLAARELVESALFYDQRRVGLGEELLNEFPEQARQIGRLEVHLWRRNTCQTPLQELHFDDQFVRFHDWSVVLPHRDVKCVGTRVGTRQSCARCPSWCHRVSWKQGMNTERKEITIVSQSQGLLGDAPAEP